MLIIVSVASIFVLKFNKQVYFKYIMVTTHNASCTCKIINRSIETHNKITIFALVMSKFILQILSEGEKILNWFYNVFFY